MVVGQGSATDHCTQAAALIAAIGARPPFPFPLTHALELWLLHKDGSTPLVWLRTERPSLPPAHRVRDLHWVTFSARDCRDLGRLVEGFPLVPHFLDPAAARFALVQARLAGVAA